MYTEHYYPLYWFLTGSKKGVQELFCGLQRKALAYKYRKYKGIAIPFSTELVRNNPIFELGEKDEVKFYGEHVINGQKFKEIYITTIFAGFLNTLDSFRDWKIKGKRGCIAYVEKEDTEVDTYIFLSSRLEARVGKKMYFSPDTIKFSLQIKECVKSEDIYSENIIIHEELGIDRLNVQKLKYYDNFILIYLRGFFQFDTEKVREHFRKHHLEDKNIFFIFTSWSEKIPERWDFNIADINRDKYYVTSFEPCNLFKTLSLKNLNKVRHV